MNRFLNVAYDGWGWREMAVEKDERNCFKDVLLYGNNLSIELFIYWIIDVL